MKDNECANKPRIQVLMSTYNGEDFVVDQIQSILDQDGVEVDILIRDDGSTDETVDVINGISDPRIKIIKGENLGYRKSFYSLMLLAGKNYDYYSFADQDDIWLKDKLRYAVDCISIKSGPAAYCSSPIYVDESLEPLYNCYSNLDGLPSGWMRPEWILSTGLAGLGCTFVWNKAMHEVIARENLLSLNIGHDNFISVIAPLVGDLFRDAKGRILYRQHTGNASGSKEKDNSKMHVRRYIRTLANLTNDDYMLRTHIAENYTEAIKSYEYGLLNDSLDYRHSARIKVKLLTNSFARGLSAKERAKFNIRVMLNKY